MGPFGYAYVQVIGQAIEATKSLDQGKLAAYMHTTTFQTIVGDVKYAANGEWAKSRVFQAQFRGIKGTGWTSSRTRNPRSSSRRPDYKSGDVIYPYEKAKHRAESGPVPKNRPTVGPGDREHGAAYGPRRAVGQHAPRPGRAVGCRPG